MTDGGVTRNFAGTGHLVRLIARRDRGWLPLWVVGNAGLTYASAVAVHGSYDGNPDAMASYAATMEHSIAPVLLTGRQTALDTIGGITLNEVSLTATLLVSLMALFTVVRHTRADEEAGRTELLRSTVLGRHAPMLAALLVTIVASAATGALNAAALLAIGLPATGVVAFGAAIALLGVAFAATTAVAAQAAASARGALGLGGLVIGVGYALRGIGAVREDWLVWATPFGWAQNVNAFGDENWWALVILAAAAFVAFVVAGFLSGHRDLGGGLWRPRSGRPRASAALLTQVGLVARQQRGLILAWGAGMAALAALYGSVIVEVPEMLRSSPDIAAYLGAEAESELVDAFIAYIFAFLGLLLSAFSVLSVLRLRTDESTGRAEVLLATAVPRWRWAAGTLAVALVSTVLLLVLTGLTLGLAHAVTTDGTGQVTGALTAALIQLPAVLVVAAVAFAVWGWTGGPWGWLLFGWAAVQVFVGDLLEFPDWLNALSPFWHVPQAPVEPFTGGPLLALGAVAVAGFVVGLFGIGRRDIRVA